MSKAFALASVFRNGNYFSTETRNSRKPGRPAEIRRRRAFIAFCAALFTLSGSFFVAGTNIPGVVADENESAAAFFRADRARYRVRHAIYFTPALTIFGGRKTTKRDRSKLARRATPSAAKNNLPFARVRNNLRFAGVRAPKEKTNPGARSVCVRLCDGYHFPVGQLARKSDVNAHEAICSGLCPGAPTRLYVLSGGSSDISEARAVRGGRSYAALPVALRYTVNRDKTCSCRRPGQPHLALVSLRKDFTLRRGDAIMTARGIRVFKGSRKYPYRSRNFTSLRRAKGVNRPDRKQLLRLERASSDIALARQEAYRLKDRINVVNSTIVLPAYGPIPPARPRMLASVTMN